jgi:hypothetical protein
MHSVFEMQHILLVDWHLTPNPLLTGISKDVRIMCVGAGIIKDFPETDLYSHG